MKAISNRTALAKVVSDEATFERFTQEIGLAYMRIFMIGLVVGLICGGIISWLVITI